MDTRLACNTESAVRRGVFMSTTRATLRGAMSAMSAMSGLGARSTLRLAAVFALMLAMLFGPVTDPSATAIAAVAADTNDHASQERPLPAGAVEVVAEAEESRDELEEQGTTPATGLLCAGWSTLASLHPVAFRATWWVGRPRLGGAGGLGRGPPARV